MRTIILLILATTKILTAQVETDNIRLNQIGFYPDAQKIGIVVGATSDIFHIATTNLYDTVYTGTLSSPRLWSYSNEQVRQADFSSMTTTGTFVLYVPGVGYSSQFEIKPYVHQEVGIATLKGFYFQRASLLLLPTWAGKWWRALGHPDNQIEIHPSAATAERPAGTIISCPKGWYDAGDYNKYIVNSGITTYTMLAMYEHFPEYFKALETNIPESSNDIPDILDEALWNLEWMLTMQDPNDGGIYHKLTYPNFSGFIMPNRAPSTGRFVVQKSTGAALDFAAVMAQASRIFSEFQSEFPSLSDTCLSAALNAWNWARKNPAIFYNQNQVNQNFSPTIHTGEYGDGNYQDELQWAAMELYITTKEDSFVAIAPPFSNPSTGLPSWSSVRTLGFYSLAHHRNQLTSTIDTTILKQRLITLANSLKAEAANSAYGVIMGVSPGDFVWGSNAVAANQGMVMIQAYLWTGDKSYLNAAIANLDYLLGRNATTYSFVTDCGDKTPLHPHHRISQADGVYDPIPGLLVGGPNPNQQDGCTYPSNLPALSYVDTWESYASNEICINWNAPIAYLACAIEAIMSPNGKPNFGTSVKKSDNVPHKFKLEQNYPNPFNSTTNINFSLDHSQVVSLKIYDLLGKEVLSLIDHEWRGMGEYRIDFNAKGLKSGIYFYSLQGNNVKFIKKMTLIR